MSTKKTIYIIRHGETDFNKRGIVQGSGIDSELNKTGLEQALNFYRAYHHVPFDRIYSSTLKRTIQSIQRFIDLRLEHETVPEFNEIGWGVFEGKAGNPDHHREYMAILEDWKAGLLDRAVDGGETPNQMYKRQQKGLEKLLSRKQEKTILICMHGRAMRSLLCMLTNKHLSQMDEFKHSNLCLYVLEQKNDFFEILHANSTEHLWY